MVRVFQMSHLNAFRNHDTLSETLMAMSSGKHHNMEGSSTSGVVYRNQLQAGQVLGDQEIVALGIN